MKSPFKTLLETALIASLVLSAVFLVQYFFRSKQFRTASATWQAESARERQIQAIGTGLLQQAAAFRQKDQSIDSALKAIGITVQGQQTNASAK